MIKSESQEDSFENTTREAFEFVSEASFLRPSRLKTSAWVEHVPFAFWIIEASHPGSFVELGTHTGTSYAAFCQAVQVLGLETKCYAIDTWKGDEQTGFYDEDVFHELATYNQEFYSGFSSLIKSTFDEALKYFEDGSIDLLHIDGCHTYEAVRHDFDQWFQKLSSRAVVLLHDTNVREREFGVFQLWKELQSRWPSFEFVHGHGLGVLGVGAELPGPLQRLFQTSGRIKVASTIRSVYARLGRGVQLRMDKEELASELNRRAERILDLERALAGKAEQVARQLSEIERMKAASCASEEQVAQLQRALAERMKTASCASGEQVAQLQRALAESKGNKRRIESLKSSRSWRVTAPLRWVDHLFSWKAGLWSNLKDEAVVFFWRIAVRFPIFHAAKVLKYQTKRVTEEELFDSAWYRSNYEAMPGVSNHPLVHYFIVGAERGCNPNPVFNSKWYWENYPKVAAARINPLFHYVEFGAKSGFNPGPHFEGKSYLAHTPSLESNPLRHYLRKVRQEIQPASTPYRPRAERLLARLTKQHKILEIGPSYNPLITRSDGWNCYSLDHGTAEELRAKYANNPDPAVEYGKRIQPVDFVWRSGPIDSAIPPDQLGTFDGVVASHVVEHTPDLVAFFESVGKILRPNGYLSLAVPDKRFCFDYFQPVSLTGDVLAAYHEKRTRHTKKTAYQASAYLMRLNGSFSVTQEPVKSHEICHPDLDCAYRMFRQQDPSPNAPYVDFHNWYFTPSSFRLICLELRILKLIDFQEVEFFDVSGNEFIVCLQRSTKPMEGTKEAERLRLLKQMVLELGDQAIYMLEGMSPAEIAYLQRV